MVTREDILRALASQLDVSMASLRGISHETSLRRYAPGKWSIREVLGHMIDTERIFAYRALRIARGDQTPLPSFDQDAYIEPARFDERPWPDLHTEFELVRRSNMQMFRGFDRAAWGRRGIASGHELTARAAAYVIAGHELHHMAIVRERYLGR